MVIVITGVSGAGKSTVGRLLASRLGWTFHEADDYHSPSNRARLSRGERLGDADRAPWLDRLAALIAGDNADGRSSVLACSALKARYRRRLVASTDAGKVRFVFLRVDEHIAAQRVGSRRDHFAPPSLVPNQFADLEEPTDGLVLDATHTPDELVERIVDWLAPDAADARGPE